MNQLVPVAIRLAEHEQSEYNFITAQEKPQASGSSFCKPFAPERYFLPCAHSYHPDSVIAPGIDFLAQALRSEGRNLGTLTLKRRAGVGLTFEEYDGDSHRVSEKGFKRGEGRKAGSKEQGHFGLTFVSLMKVRESLRLHQGTDAEL